MIFQVDTLRLAFMSKDREYAIFRKIRALNTRNLLFLQSELTYLKSELERCDHSLASRNPDSLRSWPSFRKDNKRMNLAIKMRKTRATYSKQFLSKTLTPSANLTIRC
ncbi:uncharacterized protein BDV17DRAFT_276642, partial [Aspergillus undulatus]|uniref:uncharacterized protein n=1 Tax=Aspergillus undulatus TaxID=1810928 RepID=UPI003CCC9111